MRFGGSACLRPPTHALDFSLLVDDGTCTYSVELLGSVALGLAHDEVDQVVVRHVLRVLNASLEGEGHELDLVGIIHEFECFLSGVNFLLHIGLSAKCLFYLIIC